jgi:hypothetical protein
VSIELTARDYAMLVRTFGWHAIPWIDAFSEVLSHLNLPPAARVLETGASGHSAPSLFFLAKGMTVEVTCHREEEVPRLKRLCERFCADYDLPLPIVETHDVFSPSLKSYDVILLKGVLGGLDRKHDLRAFSQAIDRCREKLVPGGHLIVLDKGWCSSVHNFFLRRFGAAGKNNWHYFSHDELLAISGQCESPLVVWKGFLSVGVMPFKWLQRWADLSDRYIFNGLLSRGGTVFGAVYRRGRDVHERVAE